MKQKSIRLENHFVPRFLTNSALLLGLTATSFADNYATSPDDSDVLRPNSEVVSGSGTRYMVFPSTTQQVRLYLIDTGISHRSEWFARNANLQFATSYSSLAQSTSSVHGSRMLDIIAGPESGAVAGTPLQVVSMNIYPSDQLSATVGSVADAIFEAIDLEDQSASPETPAVICLASGSIASGSSAILENAFNQAVEAGIPIIVSAGNASQDASNFIPSKYGSKEGVICVGAYGKDLLPLPMSNTGSSVDLLAPGENVRTLALPQPTPGASQGMTGTSPATAIATAAAIYQLSLDPKLSPAQLEEVLGSSVSAPAPKTLDFRITPIGGEKFFDVSFVSCQLLTGNASTGFSCHSGNTVAVEWSDNLKTWTSGRFTDLGPPVEVPGGWRYTARSYYPVLSRIFQPGVTTEESLVQPLESDPDAKPADATYRFFYPSGVEGDLLSGESRVETDSDIVAPAGTSGYYGYRKIYALSAGATPIDPPVQMARLRTNEP